MKNALADALVFYYHFAGRLREVPRGNILVECTAQGVLFIEADADVSLQQLGGDSLKPPSPCLEQLLYTPSNSEDILSCSLLFVQVTRLMCGGFILGLKYNHTICDGQGVHQFVKALAEIARGRVSPSILPIWERHLLNARDPPQVMFAHREFDVLSKRIEKIPSLDDVVQHSFFFGSKEFAALRQCIPPHLQICTTFELLTAWLWRSRTIAVGYNPKEEVCVVISVSTRGKFHSTLPTGFYGNAIAYPVAVSATEKLIQNPLSFALELVMKAKNEEYLRSTSDLMSVKGRPNISTVQTFFVSDMRHMGDAGEVDIGCREVVYDGPALGVNATSHFWISIPSISYTNNIGDKGCLVLIYLPRLAMKKFFLEVERMVNKTAFVQTILQPETSKLSLTSFRKSSL
ncbi:benzyl alcohol O-benzoyltransferase-like [Papaver somniferum]|uniref:benzyl alcohol O-benzoyltransferase-like n=1 Tax=Papaver somniferum TaxID=3469 RepID=UPI000E7018F5|nr:benzyl alcohol O-benzoyltransferase-like [Papaver somniferum]